VKGLALLQEAEVKQGSTDSAREAVRQALFLAREQNAVWLELRAVLSLVRLPQEPAERARGLQLLSEVCDRIEGGRDTREMLEAAELLSSIR